jgi:hypothetical protein
VREHEDRAQRVALQDAAEAFHAGQYAWFSFPRRDESEKKIGKNRIETVSATFARSPLDERSHVHGSYNAQLVE